MVPFKYLSVSGLLFLILCACSRANDKQEGNRGVNLLKNGALSEMTGAMPVHWPLGGVTDVENYKVSVVKDVHGEPVAVEMYSHMAETSRYISQEVEVEPGATYEWRAKINQEGGRGLMWVKGLSDAAGNPVSWEARTYLISYDGHPLYPDFVEGRLMRGSGKGGWREEKVDFKVPENVAKVRLSIGVYFSTGTLRLGPMKLVKLSDDTPVP